MWTCLYPAMTPERKLRKTAFRLKHLAPMCYRRAVRAGRLPQV
jgi:hypothetical protein